MKNISAYVLFVITLFSSCTLILDEIPEEERGFGEVAEVKNEYGSIKFQYNDDVTVIGQKAFEFLAKNEGDTVVYFSDNIPQELLPKIGAYVSAAWHPMLENGLNSRVMKLDHVNGMYRMLAKPVPLSRIFKSLDFDIEVDYTPDVASAIAAREFDEDSLITDSVYTDYSLYQDVKTRAIAHRRITRAEADEPFEDKSEWGFDTRDFKLPLDLDNEEIEKWYRRIIYNNQTAQNIVRKYGKKTMMGILTVASKIDKLSSLPGNLALGDLYLKYNHSTLNRQHVKARAIISDEAKNSWTEKDIEEATKDEDERDQDWDAEHIVADTKGRYEATTITESETTHTIELGVGVGWNPDEKNTISDLGAINRKFNYVSNADGAKVGLPNVRIRLLLSPQPPVVWGTVNLSLDFSLTLNGVGKLSVTKKAAPIVKTAIIENGKEVETGDPETIGSDNTKVNSAELTGTLGASLTANVDVGVDFGIPPATVGISVGPEFSLNFEASRTWVPGLNDNVYIVNPNDYWKLYSTFGANVAAWIGDKKVIGHTFPIGIIPHSKANLFPNIEIYGPYVFPDGNDQNVASFSFYVEDFGTGESFWKECKPCYDIYRGDPSSLELDRRVFCSDLNDEIALHYSYPCKIPVGDDDKFYVVPTLYNEEHNMAMEYRGQMMFVDKSLGTPRIIVRSVKQTYGDVVELYDPGLKEYDYSEVINFWYQKYNSSPNFNNIGRYGAVVELETFNANNAKSWGINCIVKKQPSGKVLLSKRISLPKTNKRTVYVQPYFFTNYIKESFSNPNLQSNGSEYLEMQVIPYYRDKDGVRHDDDAWDDKMFFEFPIGTLYLDNLPNGESVKSVDISNGFDDD